LRGKLTVFDISKKLNRFAVALGGFLIFVGIILSVIVVIGYFNLIDATVIETENLEGLALTLLLALGVMDLVAGIILWRR